MRFEFDRAKLRYGMMARGLTQEELARLAKIASTTVASALAGKAVNISTAVRIANALKSHPPLHELETLLPDAPR